jgi:hypothetical protein
MHAGLEKLEAYARKCQSGECELRMDELLAILDGFGDILWSHMDAGTSVLACLGGLMARQRSSAWVRKGTEAWRTSHFTDLARSMKNAGWTAREMSNMPF